MNLPLSYTAIQTVARWQNYGSGSKSTMKAMVKLLPAFASVPVYSGPAYRLVGLSKADLRKLVREGEVPCRQLEGWTKSQAICRQYLADSYGALLKPDTALVVIFGIRVKRAALDLEALWKTKEWENAVEAFENAGQFFDEGLDFRGSQKEVLVSQLSVRLKDVVEVIAKGGSTVKGAKCLPFLRNYVQENASLSRVVSRLQETSDLADASPKLRVKMSAFDQFREKDWSLFVEMLSEMRMWFAGRYMSLGQNKLILDSLTFLNNLEPFTPVQVYLYRATVIDSRLAYGKHVGDKLILNVGYKKKLTSWTTSANVAESFSERISKPLLKTNSMRRVVVKADVAQYAITSHAHLLATLKRIRDYISRSPSIKRSLVREVQEEIKNFIAGGWHTQNEVICLLPSMKAEVRIVKLF